MDTSGTAVGDTLPGTQDVSQLLSQHQPFASMDPALRAELAESAERRAYGAGDRVAGPGDAAGGYLYIVLSGRLRVTYGEGRESAGWGVEPGELYAVTSMISGQPPQVAAHASVDSVLLRVNRALFERLCAESQVFSAFCTRRLAEMVHRAHQRLSSTDAAAGGDTSLNLTLGERLRRDPVTCAPDTSIRAVLQLMTDVDINSMVITNPQQQPIGVFTLTDLMRRVALPDVPLDAPIAKVMTPDPVTMPSSAFAFEAAMTMAHRGIHHICVVDGERIVGMVSERDLFTLQRVGLVTLSQSISRAPSVDALERLGSDIHSLVDQMMSQGVKAGQITQIITLLNDQVGSRVIELITAEAGDALPAVEWCWLVFGSEGRREQTLNTDQDNGIVFRVPAGGQAQTIRERFLPIARRINQALDQCGYRWCEGNVMASNPECCLSLDEWRERFRRWIDQGTPEHLLNASIYFDLRPMFGNHALAEELRGWMLGHAAGNSRFRKQMAANAMNLKPPLGLFGDFKLSSRGAHPKTLNLKLHGTAPFVDAARIMALAGGITETNSVERLRQAGARGVARQTDTDAWINAYEHIQMLRMRLNQDQARRGEALSNHVSPDVLDALDRRILRETFKQAQSLQARIASDYQL
jgi:CBS domain-containing protein